MAKRYQPSELIGEHGGVQTFAGRDVVNGLPVRVYSFVGEPTLKEGELRSDFIPPVLSSSFTGLAGEVVSAFSDEFKRSKGAVAPGQVEALLRETAAALDDAAKTGVVHGDLSPERVFFDREGGASGRFVLEGYGVPWPVRPSEFSAPERIGGASFAADIFSWARTVKHLSGPLSGELRDLLDHCLNADPTARPHAREVRAALERYPFSGSAPKPNPQAHRDTSAFERYADNEAEDAHSERDGLAESRGLTLPPKAFKVKEYGRQQTTQQPLAASQPETVPEPAPEPTPEPRVISSPADRAGDALLSSTPLGKTGEVQLISSTRLRRSADSLVQRDETEAYRARLAVYNAKNNQTLDQPGDRTHDQTYDQTHSETSARDDAQAPSSPTVTPISETAAPAIRAAKPAPHVRVSPVSAASGAAHEKNRDFSDDFGTDFDDDDFDTDDFEVIDDIDDRAPDPTLYRGGRRVLLLTLLGIALLVLLALQLINA